MIRYNEPSKGLTRIGVFYDGNYFLHVSNYYNYQHPRRSRIDIGGLHDFIRHKVAQLEGTDYRRCQVVDAHYFRGRLNAYDAKNSNKLFTDRLFDDVLMNEGVVTHYLPLKTRGGHREEKGIDVWLALEAYELSIYKQFNVLVLVASDGDYVPLIRKLNTLGTRVMLLGWDFEYTTDTGRLMVTRTSQDLLEEVTYPIAMQKEIDDRVRRNDITINNMFINTKPNYYHEENRLGQKGKGRTLNMKNGYGFIAKPPNNLFFHFEDVVEGDFYDISNGDWVEYEIGKNDRGEDVAKNVRKITPNDSEKSDYAQADSDYLDQTSGVEQDFEQE